MVYEFKFPDVGEGIQEGEIVKWLIKEGDKVKADQTIVQIETDKAIVDIPSPRNGIVIKLTHKEGEKIKVGETLIIIGEKGENVKSEKKNEEKNIVKIKENKRELDKSSKKGQSVVGELEEAPEDDEEVEEKKHSEIMAGEKQTAKVLASPMIRKLASEIKIDLTLIKGSGEGGKIIKRDIDKFISKNVGEKVEIPQQTIVVKKKYDDYGYLERVPLKGIRKTIAEHMSLAWKEAPQVTTMEDIDVTDLWKLREKENKNADKRGIKLTFLPFIVKATITALKENPILNSSIEGDDIIIKKYFNIGIATETDVGLMVPVVKIAQNKTIIEIAKEIVDLTEKARKRTIDIMDLKGGTFTITNYGSVGGTYATPILNYPEASIMGLGKIFDRVVMDEKGKLRNIKILPVSVTFDHRIIDGGQAARFLESLKMFLEDPEHLMLELK